MYGAGIPVGILVDAKGPRPAIAIGAVSLGLGYFLINRGDSSTISILSKCTSY